ncbi:Pimeloyl-ACP methyl ester carboxylesterase [Streptomyces sp. DvalAA-14]|uniref:alpha/beta fold hydrolase n=1 Tax=unclassified Streptomyces TaxID=2593676 RepID=UPI00081B4F68|nr:MULTISPECIES: alpha/beta hydrolase [unclassified Streptomyces]MYS23806.1 alpha/beta fold hydrolase [Streptomyces sp. SID4948]SCE38876.1 Pimeloyl-ACP methyl ester carboxylesterase [Streptomyces sp. DvalAA-14]
MGIRIARRAAITGALSSGALVLLGAASAPSLAVATGDVSSPKPTVVLVHGAWADSSSWSPVMERLRKDGYPVRAIANPLQGLTSDSAYVSSYLATIDGPVVLVGHSYGGAVITNSGASDPDVKALVYIAAFIPAQGETVGELAAKSSSPIPLISTPVPDGTDVSIDPAHFREVGDVDPTAAADLAAVQRPANTRAVSDASVAEAFRTVPSWSLITRQDHAITPDVQRFMSERAGSHTEEVNSSHAVMISRPDVVTHVIEEAARSTR